jgi:hypothetical protein
MSGILLHLNAGDRVDFVVMDHGDVALRSASRDIRELRGMLKVRRGAVSVDEMNAAVLREHASKR